MTILFKSVLAIPTRNKDESWFRNSMSYAVNQRFDCASKTVDTVYIFPNEFPDVLRCYILRVGYRDRHVV